MATSRGRGKRQAIRLALFRLGLHSRPREVVHFLAGHGIFVSEEIVRQVAVELRKDAAGVRTKLAGVPKGVARPAFRKFARTFPRGG